MGRPKFGCARCGGQTRRQSAKNLVAQCSDCHEMICDKHIRWEDGEYVCTACNRKRG